MSANQPPNDKNDKNENNPEPRPVAYDHSKYRVSMSFLPDATIPESKHHQAAWCVKLSLQCHDLPKLMREGLWWSFANIVPNLGYFNNMDARDTPERYTHARHWVLREDPQKEESQVQWHGTIKLLAKSYSILTKFSLGQLCRDNIYMCTAFNRQGKWIFHCKPNGQDPAINCIYDGLHPGIGSWWMWPMDRLDPPPPDPDDVDETDRDPGGYANKPNDRCTCQGKQQNNSLTRDIWRAIYGEKRN